MNESKRLSVPAALAGAFLILAGGGCAGVTGAMPDENAAAVLAEETPERAAAIQEIRARAAAAEASDDGAFPFVFDADAPAGEIRPPDEVAAIEADLAALSAEQQAESGELADLQQRALRLRRLGQTHVAEKERAIEAESGM